MSILQMKTCRGGVRFVYPRGDASKICLRLSVLPMSHSPHTYPHTLHTPSTYSPHTPPPTHTHPPHTLYIHSPHTRTHHIPPHTPTHPCTPSTHPPHTPLHTRHTGCDGVRLSGPHSLPHSHNGMHLQCCHCNRYQRQLYSTFSSSPFTPFPSHPPPLTHK